MERKYKESKGKKAGREKGEKGQKSRQQSVRPAEQSRKKPVQEKAFYKAKTKYRNASDESHEKPSHELPDDVLVGRNAVTEALKAGRGINKILLASGDREGSITEITALAKERGIVVQYVERSKIDNLAAGHRHQGVLAYVAPVPYAELSDILQAAEEKGETPFLVLLDELEDPHNLGALLRTADATGVHGILIPKRRSVSLNATVAKTSAGAIEYVPVARIGNISQTLKSLKEKGFWVAGADMDGEKAYYEADLTGPLVLVVGSEGRGMSRLTKAACDFIVSMPMVGHINSLNASVAGSILMYESMRQRLDKQGKS